jgi:hypothetical protein
MFTVKWWKTHKFKVIVFLSVIIILVGTFMNDGTDGSYSLHYIYDPNSESKALNQFPKQSKGELECRRVLESLFMRPFPSQRPLFLTNAVTGKPLEIDCCNYELRLGVEYNGRQHYKYTKGMHSSHDGFRVQQYRDLMKKQLCEKNGFTLITVPYTIPINSIENYLKEELRTHGYNV